jgi:hypothetical protein
MCWLSCETQRDTVKAAEPNRATGPTAKKVSQSNMLLEHPTHDYKNAILLAQTSKKKRLGKGRYGVATS